MAEKENLSAFFDGESHDGRHLNDSLIDKLGNDSSLQDEWKSFALIRDVMQSESASCQRWDIANNVALALENEPCHGIVQAEIEPVANVPTDVANVPTDNVVTMQSAQPTPQQQRTYLPSWFQQLSQVGMAAGVALAVIVGVQQYNETDFPLAGPQPPVLQTIPLSGSAEPVSFSRKAMQSHPSEAKVMEQRRRINALFQDYELQLRLDASEIGRKDDPLASEMDERNR